MALKREYSTLEEIPEAQRAFYVQKDGKYVLDLDGGAGDDAVGLKSALEKERKAKADAEKLLKDLKERLGDLDPVKAREALKKIQDLEDRKLIDEGKVEELVAARLERFKAESAAQLGEAQKQIKELMEKTGKAEGRLSELLVDGSLRDAAVKAKVKPTLLPAFLRMARAGDIEGIRWDLRDGAPVPIVGDVLKYGKDPSKVMNAEEYLALVAEKVPDLFEPNTGSGVTPGTRSGAGAFTITRDEARDINKFRAMSDAAQKAGQELQVVG